jgi:hypothetical protein
MKKAAPQVSLAQQVRDNFKKFEAEQTENVYNDLVAIIQDVSARGAIGLDIRFYSRYCEGAVVVRDHNNIWHKCLADVDINIAPVIRPNEIAKRLEADGFLITYVMNEEYGEVIDRITWAD